MPIKRKPPNSKILARIVRDALEVFRTRRLESFENIDIKNLLHRKNPYLFCAIGIDKPRQLVDALLKAYLSSSDEGAFGYFFQPVALGVVGERGATKDPVGMGGRGAKKGSVDFEIRSRRSVRAYAVKSGPRAFNSKSRRTQTVAFEERRKRVSRKAFEAVVGYGYGQKTSPETRKKKFREVSGQAFWEEISDDAELYQKIFQPLAKQGDQHRAAYNTAYTRTLNRLTIQFRRDFGRRDGGIDWENLLRFNSGKKSFSRRSDNDSLRVRTRRPPKSSKRR
jgi:type II restriction endonuclease EcoO109I-like protein